MCVGRSSGLYLRLERLLIRLSPLSCVATRERVPLAVAFP
jgi:hypothetical protein